MSKLENCIANKLYTIKRQYPAIKEFEKRIHEVERELNQEKTKDDISCSCKRKPMCKNVCKNRQKY